MKCLRIDRRETRAVGGNIPYSFARKTCPLWDGGVRIFAVGTGCGEDVPQDCIGYVTGNRRAALGGIEEVREISQRVGQR